MPLPGQHRILRLLIIGAGARGNAYARAVTECTDAVAKAGCPWQEVYMGRQPAPDIDRSSTIGRPSKRMRPNAAEKRDRQPGVDGVFMCTLDDMHAEIIIGLAPLNLHLMSEKPLATTLRDCLSIYRSLQPSIGESPTSISSIGHVLHYSPHNVLLRKLLLEDCIIARYCLSSTPSPLAGGNFHTATCDEWQLAQEESATAPSLLTKSCHDIDYLLWLLCSSPTRSSNPPHLPEDVSSTGSLIYFKRSRKPELAGNATNCLSCPAESVCMYSAKKIYHDKFLASGNAGWPVHIVDPVIEDLLGHEGMDSAARRLRTRLLEDYDHQTDPSKIERQPWFGRCVYESDNDVCDDQIVTINWDDDPLPHGKQLSISKRLKGRSAKTATFHMIAQTEKQCERRGRVYGSKGEIEYDGKMIRVYDFETSKAQVHYPHQAGGGHGGGDEVLTRQFIRAMEATERNGTRRDEAQREQIGCTLEDIIRSHAMVFAAEEARRDRKVIDWAA